MKRIIPELEEMTSLVDDAAQRSAASSDALQTCLDAIAGFATLIHDLAAQSKLLALNASIEAARAGMEGRGFGVVANQMKGLAGQADRAAREIDVCLAEASTVAGHNRVALAALHTAVHRGMALAACLSDDDRDTERALLDDPA